MPAYRKPLPSREFLNHHLRYDPETGLLYRNSTGKLATLPGKLAGKLQKYPRVSVHHVLYSAHRVIWKMEISDDVPEEIDHINEDKNDNRLDNFRPATHVQNGRNRGLTKANKSGYKGVSWHKAMNKWQAQITVCHENIKIGFFDDPKEAYEAYLAAAVLYHGEFANDGHGPICL